MYLIQVESQKLEHFHKEEDIPPYAILSHTWIEGSEVSLQEWKNGLSMYTKRKSGYSKILGCCVKAKEDGLAYVWVDTCCIDKSSSAELSEAINSMFKWYEKAAVCYAYLSDVVRLTAGESTLSASRWFKRGWTLQELIAPKKMVFFAADWSNIGSKETICHQISTSCGIEEEYLNKNYKFRAASIAKRMSWVASRQTTRVEDMAYCLLGIFDVNMPLIYGEGQKAFRRLQEEIIKLYPEDHSIYAWGIVNQPSDALLGTAQATEHIQSEQRENHDPVHKPLLGLLAESPSEFSNSGGVVPAPWIGRFYRTWSKTRTTATPAVFIGKSIKIDLPVTPTKRWSSYYWKDSPERQRRRAVDAVLLCTPSNSNTLIYLRLVSWGDGYFGRTKELTINDGINMEKEDPSTLLNLCEPLHVAAEGEHPIQPQPYDIVIRELEVYERKKLSLWGCVTNTGIHLEQERVVRVCGRQEGKFLAYNFTYDSPKPQGFSIVLGRQHQNNVSLPGFYISVTEWQLPFKGLAWNSICKQPVLDSHACSFIQFHMKLKQPLDPGSYETITLRVSHVSVSFIWFHISPRLWFLST